MDLRLQQLVHGARRRRTAVAGFHVRLLVAYAHSEAVRIPHGGAVRPRSDRIRLSRSSHARERGNRESIRRKARKETRHAQDAHGILGKRRGDMAQHACLDIARAAEGIDKIAVVIFRQLVEGQVAACEIILEGLEHIDESLVLNRLTFAPSDRFDPDQLERTRQRINATGLLGDVRFTWDHSSRDPVLDLTIRASEGLRHEVRLGAGIGVQRLFYEVRGRLGYAHRSFLDGKSTLRAEVKPGLALLPNGGFVGWNVDAEAALDREDFFWPLLKATIALQYALTEIPAYSHQGPTARFTVGRLFLDDRLTASIGTQYRFQSFLRIEPEVEAIAGNIGLDDPLSFVSLEPTVTYDGRDDPSATTRGLYLRLRFELGQVLSGDARSYLKLLPEVRGYLPISSRVVGAARARLGVRLLGLGSLPVTQRLFAGGPESQRGFGRQRLSPFVVAADGDLIPVGGEVSLELNAEVRIGLFPVLSRLLSLVVFLDGADVTERLSELEAARLHYGLGGGLRYDTPVGPVRADIGFRLNRTGGNEPDPNDRFALHLSLGEAF